MRILILRERDGQGSGGGGSKKGGATLRNLVKSYRCGEDDSVANASITQVLQDSLLISPWLVSIFKILFHACLGDSLPRIPPPTVGVVILLIPLMLRWQLGVFDVQDGCDSKIFFQ